jgi:hypothetical protein
MYDNLVASFNIGCTTGGWYHGVINKHKLGAGHPKDPTVGHPGEYPSSELLISEFPSCPPFSG